MDLPGHQQPLAEVRIEVAGEGCKPLTPTYSLSPEPIRTVIGAKRLKPGHGIDPNGFWQEDLVPNSLLNPPGTAYRITRETSDGSISISCISVPASGGPFAVSELLVSPPGAIPDSALGFHLTDPDAHEELFELARLESLGAQVDQTAALTLEGRFLQFIRDAGSGAPPVGWNYLGGDVPDVVYISASNDVLWIFADGFDGTTIVNDFYVSAPLPIRNGAILEQTAGTFVNAIQLYVAGFSGLWLDAVSQGGIAAGHHWWPIGVIDDGGTFRVACWRVLTDTTPHGNLIETDLVTLGGFLNYSSHVPTGFGAQTDKFWVSGFFRDTSNTIIYAMEFVPPFDARSASDPTAPNYVFTDPQNHFTRTRIARVPNGQLLTVANWQFWNGSAWVSGVTNAAPLVDINGHEIHGDAGMKKISDNHYLLAVHRLMDTHLDVYISSVPQGPWTRISRVPLPTQGHSVNGPNTFQVGQLVKIVPTQVQAAPVEHSIAIISRNTIVPTLGYAAEESFTLRNIRRYAPQFAVIPHI